MGKGGKDEGEGRGGDLMRGRGREGRITEGERREARVKGRGGERVPRRQVCNSRRVPWITPLRGPRSDMPYQWGLNEVNPIARTTTLH